MKVYIDVHDKRWNKYKVDFEKGMANAESEFDKFKCRSSIA